MGKALLVARERATRAAAEHDASEEVDILAPEHGGTSSTAASAAVAKSVGEARPPGIAKCSATQYVDVPREVSRQENEGAFMAFGNGFITEADLRFARDLVPCIPVDLTADVWNHSD